MKTPLILSEVINTSDPRYGKKKAALLGNRSDFQGISISLPASLTIENIIEFKEQLLHRLEHCVVNSDLYIDARHVNRCDAAGIQLLCALKKYALELKVTIFWQEPTRTLIYSVSRLGVSPFLNFPSHFPLKEPGRENRLLKANKIRESFLQTFFEEAEESMDVVECGLLRLDTQVRDDEIIHEIFRAIHSVKGGSGTFGIKKVAELSHVVESQLDEIRNGSRPIGLELINGLLLGVDEIRSSLKMAKNREEDASHGNAATITESAQNEVRSLKSEGEETFPYLNDRDGWHIEFEPAKDFLHLGNDPTAIFSDLEQLGSLSTQTIVDDVPSLRCINPQSLYMRWSLYIDNALVDEEKIREIFSWVHDRCTLKIKSMNRKPDYESVEVSVDHIHIDQEHDGHILQRDTLKNPANMGTIRVDAQKIDLLLEATSRLETARSLISNIDTRDIINEETRRAFVHGIQQLDNEMATLKTIVMGVRYVPLNTVFRRFPRLVHNLSERLGKKVKLYILGGDIEIDNEVLTKIVDPLTHIIRNSLDHGIELPEVRSEQGKHESGSLKLKAERIGSEILIQIEDDGAGLDRQKILKKAYAKSIVSSKKELSLKEIDELIFVPGFSTAEYISEISGRGVGMDVVQKNVEDLGGTISIKSDENVGTNMILRIPMDTNTPEEKEKSQEKAA